jgi:hypothetical protein
MTRRWSCTLSVSATPRHIRQLITHIRRTQLAAGLLVTQVSVTYGAGH